MFALTVSERNSARKTIIATLTALDITVTITNLRAESSKNFGDEVYFS